MSVPPYGSYRDSDVEWNRSVPAHWTDTRLRFVAKLNPSKSEIAQRDREEDVSFIPMDAVGEDGSVRLEQTRPIGEVETGYTYFADGDVTVAKITPCFENGKGAVMRGLQGGIGFGTTELFVARPRLGTSADFLHWLFTSTAFRKLGEGAMYGAGGQKRVPDDFVRDFPVAMPPHSEQTAIAAFLDRETGKIDALVAAQRRLIELLKEKRQAVISHAVTKGLDPTAPMKDSGVEWLGQVPAHWEVKRLSTEAGFFQGKAHEPFVEDEGEHIYVSARFVSTAGEAQKNCTINLSPAKQGDILMVMSDLPNGRALARAFLVPDDRSYAVNQRVCSIRFKRGSAGFFAYQLNRNKQLLQFNDGVEQTHLKNSAFTKLSLAVPPVEEQRAIAAWLDQRVAAWDRLMNDAELATAFLQERRAALISAAVTGKIDVRGLAPEQAEAA